MNTATGTWVMTGSRYLVTPEESVPLFAFGSAPCRKELLANISCLHALECHGRNKPLCPILAHVQLLFWLQTTQEESQGLFSESDHPIRQALTVRTPDSQQAHCALLSLRRRSVLCVFQALLPRYRELRLSIEESKPYTNRISSHCISRRGWKSPVDRPASGSRDFLGLDVTAMHRGQT